MTKHKHYAAAYRAYYNTSFSPEKRAEQECQFFDDIIKEFTELGVDQKGLAKFESLFLSSLNAKSNCISSMITGSANFPVRRAEKANEREHKRTGEMFEFIEKVRKAIDKKNNPEKYASDAIRSDDKDALTKLKEKLTKLEQRQDQMKAANKILKDKKENKVERLTEVFNSKVVAEQLLVPNCFNSLGFERFELSNNNSNIKRIKGRIAELTRNSTRQTRELTIAGIKVIENAEENRIQFFFEGKPRREVIDLMKSNGFKWSRYNGCWQRLWNSNCSYTIQHTIRPRLMELLN